MFDFHAHPTFKPFNSKSIYHPKGQPLPDKELWRERFRSKKNTHPLPLILEKEVNYTSQIHLNSLAHSDIKGMCVSLYPLERVFTVTLKNYRKTFFNVILNVFTGFSRGIQRELKKTGSRAFYKIIGTLTGYDAEVVANIHHGDYHYYNQLKAERDYLLDHQNERPNHGLISYQVVNNFTEYQDVINQDKLAFILSVEGSNAFLDESKKFDQYVIDEQAGNIQHIKNEYINNITDFKQDNNPPFIVTLAHHQYNFLTGHAPSFVKFAEKVLNQEGETKDDQGNTVSYFELGIKAMGMEMIELLLDHNKGRRVLIDTKHLSAQARVDYHQFVKQRRAAGDHIPIIQTHTGVSGRPKLADAVGNNIELSKNQQEHSEFFTVSINLFDDEIIDIVESDGLMGIMLDEKRILGNKIPKPTERLALELDPERDDPRAREPQQRFEYNKKRFKKDLSKLVHHRCKLAEEKLKANPNHKKIKRIKHRIDIYDGRVKFRRFKLMHCFLSIFMNQVLYIVKVSENSGKPELKNGKAWDHICIGSDYEGVINPLDIFYYASDLNDFEKQLNIFWHKAIFLSDRFNEFKIYKDYLFGKTPSYYIKKILWDNSESFLKKYFTEEYLVNGNNPLNI